MIDEYFKKTFKPTERIIRENESFFRDLSTLEEVIVIGCSLGDVDLPYFREIESRVDLAKVAWKVSYYDHADLVDHRSQIEKLKIPPDRIEFFELSALQDMPLFR